MAVKTIKLIDHASLSPQSERVFISSADVGGTTKGYTIDKFVRRGGLSDGVEVVRIQHPGLHFDILPTRGMSLWKAWHHGEELGWKSPVRGPVHPHYVPLGESSGLGWLDGFDELLVRCGLESNGAPEFDDTGKVSYPLHGRIGNRPAHDVEVQIDSEQGEIAVVGQVEETRFHFFKARMTSTIRTRVGESAVTIRDEIENLSSSPAEIQMLYHTNFGYPFLDAGSRVVAAAETVVPRNARAAEGITSWDSYQAEQPGFEEQVYFLKLHADPQHNTEVLLKNAHATRGVSLRFGTERLPWFTLWKNTTAASDGYVTGLEPGTNFPNPRSYEGEQGRVLKLGPREKTTLELTLHYLTDPEQVQAAEARIQKLQVQPAKIFDTPQPGWCAD